MTSFSLPLTLTPIQYSSSPLRFKPPLFLKPIAPNQNLKLYHYQVITRTPHRNPFRRFGFWTSTLFFFGVCICRGRSGEGRLYVELSSLMMRLSLWLLALVSSLLCFFRSPELRMRMMLIQLLIPPILDWLLWASSASFPTSIGW